MSAAGASAKAEVAGQTKVDYGESACVRVVQHLERMWFDTAPYHQRDVAPQLTFHGQGVDGHVPALVGAPASDLEQQFLPTDGPTQPQYRFVRRTHDPLERDAVGYHERVDPPAPHHVLHIPGDRGDLATVAEPGPVDAVETHDVVGVPQDDRAIPETSRPEPVGDKAGRVRGVPLFSEHGGEHAFLRRGLHEFVDHEARHGGVPLGQFGLLGFVDAAPMVSGEPLAPAVEGEVLPRIFPAGEIRIAHEK